MDMNMQSEIFFILVGVVITLFAWLLQEPTDNQNQRTIMAAIDRLNAAVSVLTNRVGELGTSVDRVTAEIAKLQASEPAIDAASANVEAITANVANALAKLDAAVPPPTQG